MSSSDRILRAGVVGLGVGRRRHIDGYRTHPNVEVVAIADQDSKRIADVGESHHIPGRYLSLTEMLKHENLDMVSIATPNISHKTLTIEALEAGCNVLCEKPMALSTADAREMLEVSRRTGKRIMINFSTRTSEEAYSMKQAVDSGMVGDIYYVRTQWLRRKRLPGFGGWFGQKALSGGGPLIDIGVHRLDLALWLMGFPKPTWVMGSTYNKLASAIAAAEGKKFDVEDMAVAMVKFENGATLELEASWVSHIRRREHLSTRILGTKAGMLFKNVDDTYDAMTEIYLDRNGCQYDMTLHKGSAEAYAKSNMYQFADAILHDRPNPAGPEEGIRVMEILDAIYKSAETGRPVKMS